MAIVIDNGIPERPDCSARSGDFNGGRIQFCLCGDVCQDFLKVEYRKGDSLFVPVEQLDLLQPYKGLEGRHAKLSKMGGQEWARTRRKVAKDAEKLAEDLLKLYAQREASVGHACAPDTPWQREMEDAFQYEETEDQLRVIQEVKDDMERPRPMDRLVCGDVGYGKTEVAIRAAFKAVSEGRQVAVLVPTTVLAHQHYETFAERLAAFPVTVRELSRFRSNAQNKDTVEKLGTGEVDIVIGTHRLLSKDIKFLSLGLLVVDEEQRFGVKQKEKIKGLRKNVDILTLSATPIPRTLNMALTSIRDMSVIETPPEDRVPIKTYLFEHHPDILRGAITRELQREGQVYFVHNRVDGIERIAYDGTPLPVTDDDVVTAEITTRDIDRGDFPHFLLKEVTESPDSFRKTLRGRLLETDGVRQVVLPEASLPTDVRAALSDGRIRRILAIGQGTAHIASRGLAAVLDGPAERHDVTVDAIPATELSGFGLRADMSDTLIDIRASIRLFTDRKYQTARPLLRFAHLCSIPELIYRYSRKKDPRLCKYIFGKR